MFYSPGLSHIIEVAYYSFLTCRVTCTVPVLDHRPWAQWSC